jgi:hypothetical protein
MQIIFYDQASGQKTRVFPSSKEAQKFVVFVNIFKISQKTSDILKRCVGGVIDV